MQRQRLLAGALAASMSVTLCLGGCGTTADSTGTQEAADAASTAGSTSAGNGTHEPLTIRTSQGSNYAEFVAALQERYPEIQIAFESYKGYNTSEYNADQLQAGDITDIYITTYPAVEELQEQYLVDLSGEDFIANYNLTQINNVSVNGSVYLLPVNLSLFGIYYNKTLFEAHDWTVPTSLEELEALIPEIEAAGVTLSECATQFTGSSFSYFFDTAAPSYFTTLDGIQWMKDFTAGSATAAGNLEGAVETFQRWVDDGLINVGETPTSDNDTRSRFREGNTAFLINNSGINFTQNDDGTGDEYGIIPYLSVDGSNNIIITNVNNYVGISKAVEDNPQKLEDAMKVMSFLSTAEGQEAMNTRANTLTPLRDQTLEEDSPIYEVSLLVDEGKSMELVYSGWEDYVVDMGEAVYSMFDGQITGAEMIAQFDTIQENVLASGGAPVNATSEVDLDKSQVAQIVGAAFAEATGADCALIAVGDYIDGAETSAGVNGKIYKAVPLTDNVICTFNPLGWARTIQTMTLTGAQIKAYAEEGFYDTSSEGTADVAFPYVLVTRGGEALDDNTTYTVACVTESDERAAEGNMTDSGIVGQDALVSYLQSLGAITEESLVWR